MTRLRTLKIILRGKRLQKGSSWLDLEVITSNLRTFVPALMDSAKLGQEGKESPTYLQRCGRMRRDAEQPHGGFHLLGRKEEVGNDDGVGSEQNC